MSPRWPCLLQWLGLRLQESRVPNADRRPFRQALWRCVHLAHPSSTVRSGLSGSRANLCPGPGEGQPPRSRRPFPKYYFGIFLRQTIGISSQGFTWCSCSQLIFKLSSAIHRVVKSEGTLFTAMVRDSRATPFGGLPFGVFILAFLISDTHWMLIG